MGKDQLSLSDDDTRNISQKTLPSVNIPDIQRYDKNTNKKNLASYDRSKSINYHVFKFQVDIAKF